MEHTAAPTCPRCGARVEAEAAIACTACGAPLAAAIACPPGQRLSQADTIAADHHSGPADTAVPCRVLAPGIAGHLPDYDLQAVLGEGGMGVVFAARQAGLDREVAIKRVRPGGGERSVRQLIAEARLTGALEHPGIVPVHEVGLDQDGTPFYAMRRLRGRTWAERWPDLTQRQHLDVLLRVGDAVAFAHGQGVIHRDLKPGNVFLGEYGEVIVFDWGLAARLEELRPGPRRPMASGTPAYMAPEMARADLARMGPASDVYLLGAVLYEVLAGVPPHPGESSAEVLIAAADNVIDPAIPEGDLGAVAARAMATDPADRFADVRAFQQALRTCLDHQESASLAARANERLAQARVDGDYDDFARALHGFEDARALWNGNRQAAEGLVAAGLAYAERAHAAGDLDLAQALLDPTESRHVPELARLAATCSQHHHRRLLLRALGWTSLALLLVLLTTAVVGYLAVSRQRDLILAISAERDAAETALLREHAVGDDGRPRLWRRAFQEDFRTRVLPPGAVVVHGAWTLAGDHLVVDGERSARMRLPLPSSSAVHLQLDVQPGGAAEIALLAGGQGLVIAIHDRLSVSDGERRLTDVALPDGALGLARRLRIEWDRGRLRVLCDGRLIVAPVEVGALSPLDAIEIAAQPGARLGHLKIEVPWE